MAYTGTGTEADPFVVSTYSDFKYVTDNNGSGTYYWVKIADDINCADDPNYTGVQTTSINTNHVHIYADSLKCIEGLTVNAEYFMYNSYSDAVYINNIYFKNCVFKATTNDSAVYMDRYGMGRGNFTNCKFSMIASLGSYSASVIKNTTFTNCAAYFKVMNANTSATFGYWNTTSFRNVFTNSNVIVDGMQFAAPMNEILEYNIWGFGYDKIQAELSSSSVILKNWNIITPAGVSTVWVQDEGGTTRINASYVALLNCTFSSDLTTLNGTSSGSTGTLSLCGTDNTSLTLNSPNPGTMIVTTIDNLRSKDYLLSVGFLP